MFWKKEMYDWEIEIINPTDYELKFTLKASNRVFNMLFTKSKIALRRKHNLKVTQENVEGVDQFSMSQVHLPKMYYNTVRTAIKSIYNERFKECRADGIELLSNEVDDVRYIRRKEKKIWDIIIKIKGQYVDKRKE